MHAFRSQLSPLGCNPVLNKTVNALVSPYRSAVSASRTDVNRRFFMSPRSTLRPQSNVDASGNLPYLPGYVADAVSGTNDRSISSTSAAYSAVAPKPREVHTQAPVGQGEAEALFDKVWHDITQSKGGVEKMHYPREIVWLSGAPGAGKGTMGAAVKRERDIAHIVEVSSLLSSARFKALKERGELIGDREVLEAVLLELLDPKYKEGVIMDGFPRTVVQAHLITCLKRQLDELWETYRIHPHLRQHFRRPMFQICVLYCSEEESVKRQLRRGQELMRLNRVAEETGVGSVVAARATDVDEEAARKRYKIFKEEVFESLQAIKSSFPFHFINADSDPESVRKQIARELHYQSSLDLAPDTYEMVHSVESAHRVIQQARTKMVTRLNAYASDYPDLFRSVIALLNSEFIHIVKRQALAGQAVIRTNNGILENPVAINMCLDVLSERGFRVVLDVLRTQVPVLVEPYIPGDTAGQRIRHTLEKTYVFRIGECKEGRRSGSQARPYQSLSLLITHTQYPSLTPVPAHSCRVSST